VKFPRATRQPNLPQSRPWAEAPTTALPRSNAYCICTPSRRRGPGAEPVMWASGWCRASSQLWLATFQRRKLTMVRPKHLLLAGLAILQAGCAGQDRKGYADAGSGRPPWACRMLNNRASQSTDRDPPGHSVSQVDLGAVAAVLVVWPVLAGACLAARS